MVEAKPSASREHVRLAIGQVLDYVHLLAISGQVTDAAILLPIRPSADLCQLLEHLGIQLIFEAELGRFVFEGAKIVPKSPM